MDCPKCKKGTAVLVTKEQRKKVTERRGLIRMLFRIITFPIWGLWRLLFSRKQKFHKKTYWHCNYCNKDWPQEFD